MKERGRYIVVGLVVLMALCILVFGVLFLNDTDPREKYHEYNLRIDQVSTLTPGDPVKVNGVKLGRVEDINLWGTKVRVRVRLRDDVRIPRNSTVRVQNIGLMGERQVGILLGDSAVPYSPGDTIDGIFDAGIAEAMGLAGEVFDSTRSLVRVVRSVVDSTVASPEFQGSFKRILSKTEALEDRLGTMLDETDPQLRASLADLREATRKVNVLLDENRQPISNLMSQAQGLTGDAGRLLVQVDTLTGRLLYLTDRLRSRDNTAGALLNDRQLHDELDATVGRADSLFNTILRDGLDVNIDFF